MMACRALLVMALALTACSSVPPKMFNQLEPPISGPHVELHYLGSGGWLIQRDSDRIATAPYVSNTPWYALLFPAGPKKDVIDRVIPVMNDVKIILVGHGHYDHAMDLPYIAAEKAPAAKIYGGRTVVNTLSAVPELNGRLETIKDAASGDKRGEWVYSESRTLRFMPLRSTHAPHFAGRKLIPWWTVDEKQTKLPCCPYWWKEGETFAFIIDFLDDPDAKNVVFRIYYQDAASNAGTGVVPRFEGREAARVDVAILCVAAFDQVDGNPEHILTNVQPRNIIGGHWEDFFSRSFDDPVRPAFGTSLKDFNDRARAVSSGSIYLPEPGKKVFLPITTR